MPKMAIIPPFFQKRPQAQALGPYSEKNWCFVRAPRPFSNFRRDLQRFQIFRENSPFLAIILDGVQINTSSPGSAIVEMAQKRQFLTRGMEFPVIYVMFVCFRANVFQNVAKT